MLICRNAEGVHAYLSKCWKSNCSSVLMLRGYMVRKSLGTPALEKVIESSPIQFRLCFFLHSHGSVTSGRAAPISACMRRRQRGCFRGLRLLQWQHRAWIVLFHPPSSKLNRSQERFFKSDPTSWNRNQPTSFLWRVLSHRGRYPFLWIWAQCGCKVVAWSTVWDLQPCCHWK